MPLVDRQDIIILWSLETGPRAKESSSNFMVTKSEEQGGVVEIVGAVQSYDWGIVGSNSTVAKLDASNAGRSVDEARPYAEVS